MLTKEIALRLLESNIEVSKYFDCLEKINNYNSNTKIGQIRALFEEYHKKSYVCDYEKSKLIEKIEEVINNE